MRNGVVMLRQKRKIHLLKKMVRLWQRTGRIKTHVLLDSKEKQYYFFGIKIFLG